jgi:hypothetical protein
MPQSQAASRRGKKISLVASAWELFGVVRQCSGRHLSEPPFKAGGSLFFTFRTIILYIPHHREKHARAKIALETALSPSTKQIIMIGKGRYAQLRDVLLLHSRDPRTQGALRDPLAYHGRTLEMEDPPRPGDFSRHS